MQKAILIGRGYWGKILQGYIQKHYEISHIFGSDVKDEVLKNALSKVDSAFIATPLSSHFKLSKLALEHNCNVFVEKPSTATKEEFEILLNLAKKNNKILFTDYIYTFSRSILYALQMLQGKHIESIQAEITQYGNFYENESVLEVIGVHYISVFAFMQELGLLHNLCVKECKFLDSKKQSATLELSALQNRENGDRKITLSLHCSLLSNDKKRLLCIRTTDSTICVDMLSQSPLSIIESKFCAESRLGAGFRTQSSKSLPIFDEKNNLSFAVESFVNMCAKIKQDSSKVDSTPCHTEALAEVSSTESKRDTSPFSKSQYDNNAESQADLAILESNTNNTTAGVALNDVGKSTNLETTNTNSTAGVSWSDFKCFQSKGEGSYLSGSDQAFCEESLKSTQETTQIPSNSKIVSGKCGLQEKSQGSLLDINDRSDFSQLPHLSPQAELQKETTQNLHLNFSHTTLNLLSQAHNLAQVSTPKP